MKKNKKGKVTGKIVDWTSNEKEEKSSRLNEQADGSSFTSFKIDLGYTSNVEFSFDDLQDDKD